MRAPPVAPRVTRSAIGIVLAGMSIDPLHQHRISVIRNLVGDYVRSPSLVHLRSVHALDKLASEIVRRLDAGSPLWTKWNDVRDELARASCPCWIPSPMLVIALNALPGPKLTATDVTSRIEVLQEELGEWPRDHLRSGCEAILNEEIEAGTELMAILFRIRSHIDQEEARLHEERERAYKERTAAERARLEARFLAGADSKWTPVAGSKTLYCRMNGRVFRLVRAVDGKQVLERIASHNSDTGILVGRYASRGDATAAVREVAYKPDFLP